MDATACSGDGVVDQMRRKRRNIMDASISRTSEELVVTFALLAKSSVVCADRTMV